MNKNNKKLQTKSVEELKTLEKQLRKELSDKSFDLRIGVEKKSHELRNLKKEIARILTLLAQK